MSFEINLAIFTTGLLSFEIKDPWFFGQLSFSGLEFFRKIEKNLQYTCFKFEFLCTHFEALKSFGNEKVALFC